MWPLLKDRLLGGESVDPNDPNVGLNQPPDRIIQSTDFRLLRRGQRTYQLAHSSMPGMLSLQREDVEGMIGELRRNGSESVEQFDYLIRAQLHQSDLVQGRCKNYSIKQPCSQGIY